MEYLKQIGRTFGPGILLIHLLRLEPGRAGFSDYDDFKFSVGGKRPGKHAHALLTRESSRPTPGHCFLVTDDCKQNIAKNELYRLITKLGKITYQGQKSAQFA